MSASLYAFVRDMKVAQMIAGKLGSPCHKIIKHEFPDGENLVTVTPSTPTALIYITLDHPDDKLFPLLLAADALRRNGAKRLVLVAPYMCYMRQDKAFEAGQAVSQQVIGKLFAGHFDRIVTVDAHLHRTPTIDKVFPGIEGINLLAADAIADALGKDYDANTYIIGPDEESTPLITAVATRLGCKSMAGKKIRHGDHEVELKFPDPTALKGCVAVMVDDIISSGTTVKAATEALKKAGAKTIDVAVTHALFPPQLVDEFRSYGVRSVKSTNSVPHPTNSISLDDLLASALRAECGGA